MTVNKIINSVTHTVPVPLKAAMTGFWNFRPGRRLPFNLIAPPSFGIAASAAQTAENFLMNFRAAQQLFVDVVWIFDVRIYQTR